MGAAVAGSAAWKDGRASRIGAAACALLAVLDLCLRPTLTLSNGLAAFVTVAVVWWFARTRRRAATVAVAAAFAAMLGCGGEDCSLAPSRARGDYVAVRTR